MDDPISGEFTLKLRVGAQTAILIAEVSRKFRSTIEVSYKDHKADGKNIMELLFLESGPLRDVTNKGLAAKSQVTVSIKGPDARAALDALADRFLVK